MFFSPYSESLEEAAATELGVKIGRLLAACFNHLLKF
jgi:hypothetical protein